MPHGTGVASVIHRSSNQDGQQAANTRMVLRGNGSAVVSRLWWPDCFGRRGKHGPPPGVAVDVPNPAAFAVVAQEHLGHHLDE